MPTTINTKKAKSFLKKAQTFEGRIFELSKSDPWYPILLGSKDNEREYKLEFSFGAVRRLFQDTGLDISASDIQMDHLGNMELLLKVLTAGLSTHHPDITEEAVADLLNMRRRVYYAFVVSKAMQATQPDLEDIQELVNDVNSLQDMEEGDTSAPLPEIVPSPISGQPAE